MKLENYRNLLRHTDWDYLHSDDTWRWKPNQKNAEYLRELSFFSERHRCLYSGHVYKHKLNNKKLENKFND